MCVCVCGGGGCSQTNVLGNKRNKRRRSAASSAVNKVNKVSTWVVVCVDTPVLQYSDTGWCSRYEIYDANKQET